jgi:RNA polymerase sigma factor (sigma-70 family)
MNAPSTSWTDTRLVERCLQGDERAWLVLVERYKNLVYSIPVKHGVPPQDAADVFQGVWLDLFHDLARLREPQALQAWLIRAASRRCHHWKREREPAIGEWQEDEIEKQAGSAQSAPGVLAEVEREQTVRDAIADLPPRCRQLVEMLFFESPPVPYAEIARRLRLAPGSIAFIRARCLKRLRRVLEERGF